MIWYDQNSWLLHCESISSIHHTPQTVSSTLSDTGWTCRELFLRLRERFILMLVHSEWVHTTLIECHLWAQDGYQKVHWGILQLFELLETLCLWLSTSYYRFQEQCRVISMLLLRQTILQNVFALSLLPQPVDIYREYFPGPWRSVIEHPSLGLDG